MTLLNFSITLEGLEQHLLAVVVSTERGDLEGARKTLEERRVSVLEFEYHYVGFWRSGAQERRYLKDVVKRLHAMRYECFWQGNSDQLAPVSGPFWCDEFEVAAELGRRRTWGNLVCAHESRIVRALFAYARRSGTVTVEPASDTGAGREDF